MIDLLYIHWYGMIRKMLVSYILSKFKVHFISVLQSSNYAYSSFNPTTPLDLFSFIFLQVFYLVLKGIESRDEHFLKAFKIRGTSSCTFADSFYYFLFHSG